MLLGGGGHEAFLLGAQGIAALRGHGRQLAVDPLLAEEALLGAAGHVRLALLVRVLAPDQTA